MRIRAQTNQHTWRPLTGPVGLLTVCEVVETWQRATTRIQNDYWILDYEFGPAGRCRVGTARGGWEPRGAGTAHLYPPRVPYWEDTRSATGQRHSAWIVFAGGDHLGLRRFLGAGRRHAQFTDSHGELGDLFQALARVAHERGEQGFWRAQALFWEILGILHRTSRTEGGWWQSVRAAQGGPPPFAARVESWLQARMAEPVRVGQIARQFGISRSLLFQRLRRESGETPLGLLARLRVAEAKRLILEGVPLKQAADRLGFCDQFHLSKTFKRLEGFSPRVLRRMRK